MCENSVRDILEFSNHRKGIQKIELEVCMKLNVDKFTQVNDNTNSYVYST